MNSFDLLSDTEYQTFLDLFPSLLRTISSSPIVSFSLSEQAWVSKLFEYNVAKGRMYRPRTVLMAKNCWAQTTDGCLDFSTHILAWCLEIINAAFCIGDDLMDGDEFRRAEPCWYRLADGQAAMKDYFVIQSAVFLLLKKHFKGQRQYVYYVEMFHKGIKVTAHGEALILRGSSVPRSEDFNKWYTPSMLKAVAFTSSTYYSYILPVELGSAVAGMQDFPEKSQVLAILDKIGFFYAISSDFFDVYGKLRFTGKIGTDIGNGKVSWPVVKALEVASTEQLYIIASNYGRRDGEKTCVQAFNQIKIPEMYAKKEQDMLAEVEALISGISNLRLQKLLKFLLAAVPTSKQFNQMQERYAGRQPETTVTELNWT